MRTLQAHIQGYTMQQKTIDEILWRMGIYVQVAVSVAVEHNLAGRKAQSKYLEKPLLHNLEQENKPLTEDEKMQQVDFLFASLSVMQANFEASHDGGGTD